MVTKKRQLSTAACGPGGRPAASGLFVDPSGLKQPEGRQAKRNRERLAARDPFRYSRALFEISPPWTVLRGVSVRKV